MVEQLPTVDSIFDANICLLQTAGPEPTIRFTPVFVLRLRGLAMNRLLPARLHLTLLSSPALRVSPALLGSLVVGCWLLGSAAMAQQPAPPPTVVKIDTTRGDQQLADYFRNETARL